MDGPHLDAETRALALGEELLVNDHRVRVLGQSDTLPRFPPRPLISMTLSNADRVLPPERHRITFVLASAAAGVDPRDLALRIAARTGLRARAADDFKADTVRSFLVNSEDVGDIAAMLSVAMSVGFGVTAVMLYMFTTENLRPYALLKAMGATSGQLAAMVLAQAAACAFLGTGIGLGMCAIAGRLAVQAGYPFRMMAFAPLLGVAMVTAVSAVSALISARPAVKLAPGVVFSGR